MTLQRLQSQSRPLIQNPFAQRQVVALELNHDLQDSVAWQHRDLKLAVGLGAVGAAALVVGAALRPEGALAAVTALAAGGGLLGGLGFGVAAAWHGASASEQRVLVGELIRDANRVRGDEPPLVIPGVPEAQGFTMRDYRGLMNRYGH